MEYMTALIPVAIAAIPLLVLAGQMSQQNRLERKRVEVEYLRKTLEVFQTLIPAVMRSHDMADELVLRRATEALSEIQVLHEIRKMARDWSQVLHEFNARLSIAIAFAAEQQLHDFQEALQWAFRSGHKLENIVTEAMKRATNGPPVLSGQVNFGEFEEINDFIAAETVASGRIVKRLRELYG